MVSPTPRMNSLSRTCSGTAGSSAGGVSGVVLPVGVVAHPASVSARHSERRVLRPLMSLAPRGSANVDHYLAVGPLRGLFYGLNHVLECEVRRYHHREVEHPGLHEPYDVVVYAVSGVAPYPYDLVRPGYEHVHVHGGARRGPAQVYYLSVSGMGVFPSPAASTCMSAPRPPVNSSIMSPGLVPVFPTLYARSAPSFFARESLSSITSKAITRLAPATLASATEASPMGPAPNTVTTAPGAEAPSPMKSPL